MKCSLTLAGKTYESAEYNERHVTTLIASIASGGINLKELFEAMLGEEAVKESLLGPIGIENLFRDFTFEMAERNIDSILKAVFPTLELSTKQKGTATLIAIATPMLQALVEEEAKNASEPGTPEPPIFEPVPAIDQVVALPEEQAIPIAA